MVERRGRKVNRLLVEAVGSHLLHSRNAFGRCPTGQGALDAFGPAGRARAVEHGIAHGLVGDRGDGACLHGFLVGCPARLCPSCHQAHGAGVDQRQKLASQTDVGGDDDGLGRGVLDDVGRFLGGQVAIDAGDVQTRTERGPGDLEELQMVLHDQGDVIAGGEPGAAQRMCGLVRLPVQIPPGERFPAAGSDHGHALSLDFCPAARVHAGIPPLLTQ